MRAAGYKVVPIPGVSALTTLISVTGFVGKTFTFEGFLSPRKGRRKKRLQELLDREEAFVLYESPFRIVKLLEEIAALAPSRRLLVGREMTKSFEEFLDGTASVVAASLTNRLRSKVNSPSVSRLPRRVP